MNDRLDQLIGSADFGRLRLVDANRKAALIDEVCRRIGQRHALTPTTVKLAPLKWKHHHIVMARSHAAWTLKQAGLTNVEIARAFQISAPTVGRMAKRWQDHLSGRLNTVSEDQAHAVRDLIKAGMSEAQACDQVGVGITRFQSRETIMRMEGKL